MRSSLAITHTVDRGTTPRTAGHPPAMPCTLDDKAILLVTNRLEPTQ